MRGVRADRVVWAQSAVMVGVDGALAAGALLAPARTLRLLGHREPSEDAVWLFRRCGPIWGTARSRAPAPATTDEAPGA